MTMNNQPTPLPPDGPDDLLEAYALGSLEEGERDAVEDYLAAYPHCSGRVAELEETSALLADMAPQLTPPAGLRARVMAAVDALPPVFVPQADEESSPPVVSNPASHFTFSSFALPLAATLVIGLLTASLIMNVVTTTRINSLEQERVETNARLEGLEMGHASASAGIAQLAVESHQADSALKQVMETSYLMARPFTQPLLLQPTDGRSDSEGVLLVTGDGKKAILMLANMEQSQPSQAYQVWLARNGQHLPVGRITVDSTGWGTMALNPPESLYGYDWMNLTVDKPDSEVSGGSEMVLQTRIISPAAR
jgi:anti-sigma factor RsiW